MNKTVNNIDIILSTESSWKVIIKSNYSFWFKGYIHNLSIDQLLDSLLQQNYLTIKTFLNKLDGHFSIVLKTKKFSLFAVDKVRSCPIIWSLNNKFNIVISDKGSLMKKKLKLNKTDINKDICKSFSVSGYTIGDNTIYKNIKQINPGSFLWVENKTYSINRYYIWNPWLDYKKEVNLSHKLNKLNERIFKKMITSLNNRQVVVPLSGGLDSRLIVSGLKKFNYKNVLCISYGLKNNRDATIAKKVAEKLGYRWLFIEYTIREFKNYYYSKEYSKYKDYCDSFTGIHFVGEYIMLKKLGSVINSNAIIINGQSGDFISGNHIPKDIIYGDAVNDEREKTFFSNFISKHYKHWKALEKKENLLNIENLLKKEIKNIGGFPENINKDYALYEYLEFMDRQSKYVINGVRNYEYFGYEWRLPLWDNDYLEFWKKIPLNEKYNQKLYKNTLAKYNWEGVWKNIKVNPLKITPTWIIPLRFAAKIVFLFLGKRKWHKFEKKYFNYFMNNLVSYAPWSYLKIIFDKRGSDSSFGWIIEDYLRKKNLNWKGE